MTCVDDPGPDGRHAVGVCHVCAMRDSLPPVIRLVAGTGGRRSQPIKFCPGCCHWMCEYCWTKVMGRLAGFVKEHVRPSPNCCGPVEEKR